MAKVAMKILPNQQKMKITKSLMDQRVVLIMGIHQDALRHFLSRITTFTSLSTNLLLLRSHKQFIKIKDFLTTSKNKRMFQMKTKKVNLRESPWKS